MSRHFMIGLSVGIILSAIGQLIYRNPAWIRFSVGVVIMFGLVLYMQHLHNQDIQEDEDGDE